ncbi:MAG: hypothetical protein ACLTGJ_08835 [Faecalibacterium prausnitzii]
MARTKQTAREIYLEVALTRPSPMAAPRDVMTGFSRWECYLVRRERTTC